MWLPRIRFSVWHLMILMPCRAALMYMLLTLLITPMREAAMDRGCKANLRAIGLALLSYHASYGCYPPAYTTDFAGRPMHSWRALILPFAGENALFQTYRLDEPWDGPKNSRLAGRMPAVYACPAHSRPGYSNYAVVVGPGTVFPGPSFVSFSQIRDPRACLVVALGDGGIPWLEPRELRVPAFKAMDWNQYDQYVESTVKDLIDLRRQGLSGDNQHPEGANFLFSPVQVESWRYYGRDGVTLRAMLTIDGGELWYHDDRY